MLKKSFYGLTIASLPQPPLLLGGWGREGVVEDSQIEGVNLNLGSQVKSVLPVTVAGK